MRYVLLILLLVSATTANFRGKEYPDSLRLYGSLDNGYVNKHRKVLDVDYWFDGKIVASKFGIRNDDSVMVDWFTIKLGNGKMGHCKVSKHDYSRYDIGDTIGVTKRTIITQAKPKSEQKHW